jgi:RHS repeat-associated protein
MPYGGTAFSAGKNQKEVALKDYRYSGKERDDSTGLYYYGQRYYVPWMCRWLNPDPIGQKGGLNLYEFVQSNPINLIDPNGEAPVTVERGMGLDARSYALRKSHWSWMLTKELGYSAWNFFSGGFLQSHDRMLEKRLKGKAYAKRFAVELSKSAVTVASSLVGGNLARGAKTAGAAMIRGGIGGGLTNAATIGYGELIESSVYRRKFNFKSVGKSALIGFVFGAIAGKVNFKLVQLRTKNIDNILSKLDNEFGFGKNFLATTKPGKIGISIGRKLTPTELAALSHKHKVEFGIVQSLDANKKIHYQLHSGSYMKIKYSYTPGHTESKIIVHTHPAMLLNKFSSGIDRKTLRKTPNQISAEIVPLKTGTFKVSLTLNKNTHTYYSRPFGKQLQGLKKVLKKP